MRAVLGILAFVALTVPLTWLWVAGVQETYTEVFTAVAGPGLEAVGVTGVAESPARKRFINYVPFLVLMAITPRLSMRRRVVGLVVGLVLIFLCHMGIVAAEAFALSGGRPTKDSFSTVFPAVMFADAFPFILWAIIANRFLRETLGRAFEGPGAGPAADVPESDASKGEQGP
jgi:hypothetical protein